jgi:hypothetical protein
MKRRFRESEIDAEVELTESALSQLGLPRGNGKRLLKVIGCGEDRAPFETAARGSVPKGDERRQLSVMFCDPLGSTAFRVKSSALKSCGIYCMRIESIPATSPAATTGLSPVT